MRVRVELLANNLADNQGRSRINGSAVNVVKQFDTDPNYFSQFDTDPNYFSQFDTDPNYFFFLSIHFLRQADKWLGMRLFVFTSS